MLHAGRDRQLRRPGRHERLERVIRAASLWWGGQGCHCMLSPHTRGRREVAPGHRMAYGRLEAVG